MTDKINYLPGGLVSGKVTYFCSFNDLSNGLQTHCYAPLGLDIRGKWTLGGSLPGEPIEAAELGLGVPKNGLYLREDTDFRCNIFMTKFVKKNLKTAHATLVERMIEKAHLSERIAYNARLSVTKSGFPPYASSSHTSSYSDHHHQQQQQEAPSYADSRSSKSYSSPFASPSLPYQSLDHKQPMEGHPAPPYPYHGVDPSYSEAPACKETNPYDRVNSWHDGSEHGYQPIELASGRTPVDTTQSFGAVELPVHEVAPLRIQKESPRGSSQMEAPPVPNRLPGGGRPSQSQR